MEHSLRIDAKAFDEYKQFQEYWTQQRAEAAIDVSKLFEKVREFNI